MNRDEFLARYVVGQRNFSDLDIRYAFLSTAGSNSNVSRSVYSISPDFSKLDLSSTNLSGIIPVLINLDKVNFSDSDLSDADLRGSAFGETNLSQANLSGEI
jgi:uncharacterized protein YjbI with pentapeptide repeats